MNEPADIGRHLAELCLGPEEIAAQARAIYEEVLRRSPRLTAGNFTQIAPADLALLFDLYDERFFGGGLGQLVRAGGAPLTFALSSRLTKSAGVTKRFSPRVARGAAPAAASRYEISLSTTLLFQTFRDVERTVRVNGLVCRDRLEAAQRVFEHELLHLLELLVWSESDCDASRFAGLAAGYFGHTLTKHDLVTQQERARATFDVRVGDRVSFEYEGAPLAGVVNRITRRATVLVESERGTAYSDGKRYVKYYIPLAMLTKLSGP